VLADFRMRLLVGVAGRAASGIGLTAIVCDDLIIAAFTEASIPYSFGLRLEGIWRSSCTTVFGVHMVAL
jgi:hypothetical protein